MSAVAGLLHAEGRKPTRASSPWPKPRAKPAQNGARPRHAVHSHRARSHDGVAGSSAPAEEVWRVRHPQYLWRTGSIPGKESRRWTHLNGGASAMRQRQLGAARLQVWSSWQRIPIAGRSNGDAEWRGRR
jgi:hypothetical protein